MIGRRLLSAVFAASVLLAGNATPALAEQIKNNVVAEYQPSDKKNGIGKILNWGLAKVEKLYDGVKVSDLLSAFVAKCDDIIHIMVHSFKDMTLSYTDLHQKELDRLKQFDIEFKDLVKLRNKIDRKCMYTTDVDDRSACVDKGIDVNSKIIDLKNRRLRSIKAIERYKGQVSSNGCFLIYDSPCANQTFCVLFCPPRLNGVRHTTTGSAEWRLQHDFIY